MTPSFAQSLKRLCFQLGKSNIATGSMTTKQETLFWLVLFVAAILEVGGDALIRAGEKEKGSSPIILGCLALATYGIVINLLSGPEWLSKWIPLGIFERNGIKATFSMQLGVYVAVFALVSVVGTWALGKLHVATFEDTTIPLSTWIGLVIICGGAIVIRYF